MADTGSGLVLRLMTEKDALVAALRLIADGGPEELGVPAEIYRSGDADYRVVDAMRAIARRALED